jgi:hypothetical protein
MSRFHSQTLALLPSPLPWSERNAQLLATREKSLELRWPASVREWYALEGATGALRTYSNDDKPIPLEELGEPFEDWYGRGHRDFRSERLLVFMHENQGVCSWAIRLDGSEDPPVVVQLGSRPREDWLPLARSFSEFLYCQIWDYSLRGAACESQEPELDEAKLQFLRTSFREEPRTYGWPGSTNYRFSAPTGRILIWHSEKHGADWIIQAASHPQLEELLRQVWSLGSLATTLYGRDAAGEQALDNLRR